MADAEISPAELKFRFQLNKQLPAAITIHNPGSSRLAFKVKTTTPKKYVVRPSSGVVEPNSTANVQVIMQAQKEIPQDLSNCKDKFLVQCKTLGAGEEATPETFKSGSGIKDTKIRVVLDGPPAPPSPVPEVNEGDDEVSVGRSAGTTEQISSGAVGTDAVSLSAENRALRAQLERMQEERNDLRARLTAAGKRSTTGSSRGMASMSLLPVLLVGLLAFLVGHYLTHVPLLTELLSSVLGDSKRV